MMELSWYVAPCHDSCSPEHSLLPFLHSFIFQVRKTRGFQPEKENTGSANWVSPFLYSPEELASLNGKL